MTNRLPLLTLFALTTLLPACGGEPQTSATYYRDVKPILDNKCVSCHQDGQIGVGPLGSYEDASLRASIVLEQIEDKSMPPWLAADGCNEYVHDPSLSEDEITTIRTWLDAGAPPGEGSDGSSHMPEPPLLADVSHELRIPEPYSPSTDRDDDYRCFVIDWPETDTRFVTGFGVRVDNASTVHHLIAYVATPEALETIEQLDADDVGPGYKCFGGPGIAAGAGTGFIGAWAPGVLDHEFPKGTGIRVDAGNKLVVQLHYNAAAWDREPDQTGVVVKVADSVEREAHFQFWANPAWLQGDAMKIPAGDPDVEHSFAYDPTPFVTEGRPFDIFNVGVHMHTRGKSAKLAILRESGDEDCLLDVPRWDFDWQFGYGLQKAARFEPGDQLAITCHFDNSLENQPYVGGHPKPPTDLAWGDGTNDEMCLGTLYIVPD